MYPICTKCDKNVEVVVKIVEYNDFSNDIENEYWCLSCLGLELLKESYKGVKEVV